ncbi:MAG: hypothetical protein JNJ69_14780 [Leptospiraceae bacterium]|nr:hypothetical protein [Leptospiraceae bacterium]
MSTATTADKGAGRASSTARVYNARHTLDTLAEMSSAELDALYRSAALPADLSVVNGKPKGRMLAVDQVGQNLVATAIRRFSAMGVFPWDGKTFSHKSGSEGTGINRVKLLVANMDWFPFATRVQPSAIDGKPCIYLDYEQPENPWFIAKIHDEIREVSQGLFMGPAMWKRENGPLLILWFAVDFNKQS